MKIEIHELATKEFDEAIEWYENQSRGLGKRFKKTVIDQIKKIKNTPTWFLVEADNIYKAYIPKFPYKILFTTDNDRIIIWAIAHMHREPWYWQFRKS
ncbi:MAG: type II toxin-antitoxin system RelE/ParE family toxin [Candidatus Riflebacteria bacterium]|nr:type II toxin-antitoxin system RelE/ParE family toxin [Candidatus Riflebacteria bacterium]